MKNVLLANSPQIILSLLCKHTDLDAPNTGLMEIRHCVQQNVYLYVVLIGVE